MDDSPNYRSHIFAVACATAAVAACLNLTSIAESIPFSMLAFILSVVVIAFVARLQPVADLLITASATVANWLDRRETLRSDPVADITKFALLRVLFGLFLLERAGWVLYYMFPADWQSPELVFFSIAALLAALLIALGFLTQWCLGFLVLVQWQVGERLLGTSTLGNDVAAILALLLMFTNAGAHLSVDASLRRRSSVLGKFVAAGYYRGGAPSHVHLQVSKLLALFSYWLVCVYSLAMHLGEPAWLNGTAGPLVLANKFMSAFADEFGWLFAQSEFAVQVGRVAMWVMLPWYAMVLPGVLLGGSWLKFVIGWGLAFFTVSLFVLQLGWLAHFEFLLWAGLFWSPPSAVKRRLDVAFDDRCNLCDRTITAIKWLDVFEIVRLRPVTESAAWLASVDLSEHAALKDLHGVDAVRHRRWSGYAFYRELCRRLVLLWPLRPLLAVGQYSGIGPWLYRYVADRRLRMFGVCRVPRHKPNVVPQTARHEVSRLGAGDPLLVALAHVTLLALAYLATLPPLLERLEITANAPGARVGRLLADNAHIYGIAPINVFNATDLRMAENWFTIDVDHGRRGTRTLPLFDAAGRRLAMHRSDRVYFGHTLRFRRATIDSGGCQYDRFKGLVHALSSATPEMPDEFIYTQYHQPLPEPRAIVVGEFRESPSSVVCSVRYRI